MNSKNRIPCASSKIKAWSAFYQQDQDKSGDDGSNENLCLDEVLWGSVVPGIYRKIYAGMAKKRKKPELKAGEAAPNIGSKEKEEEKEEGARIRNEIRYWW